ncbi:FAD-dependent oxidoreductase [Oecophyllibacter saccharovorans]|uniref:FAD-dependent oxidoreductase n=1 Tax=Oecophyllibacter saccharovorans TaxID=2558360 RepID=UPI001E48AAB0|nr:FAD-dependent oxidoreductase [Oecophyllibacter saccharovorans]
MSDGSGDSPRPASPVSHEPLAHARSGGPEGVRQADGSGEAAPPRDPHAKERAPREETAPDRQTHDRREDPSEEMDPREAERSFHDVASLDELKEGEMKPVTVAGKSLVLIRHGGHVIALGGKCPHKGAPMEKGAACHSPDHGDVVVCPWHKAVFSQATGKVVEPVAFAPLPRYPAKVIEGRVLVRPTPEAVPEPERRGEGETVLIIGGGAAAASAVYTLREEGFAGPITMVGSEPELPYDRTTLSKTLLLGDPDRTRAPLLLPQDYYDDRKVTTRHERVTSFDPATHTAHLPSGATLSADHVLLVPGGRPRMPSDIPGLELEGVLELYTQAQAQTIARVVTPEQAVVLIGGGLICLEVASALRQKGVGVTIITRQAVPMEAQFGREIGLRLLKLQEDNGVAFISDCAAKRVYADPARPGQAAGVELEDGMKLPCAHVLVAAGIIPNVDFVSGDLPRTPAGALIVDRNMRVHLPDALRERREREGRRGGIYAAGDASSLEEDGRFWQSGHWRPAEVEGRIAAQTMLKHPPRTVPVPWYWTQQFGKKIEYLGWGLKFDNVVVEGSLPNFDFMAYCQFEGRIVALISSGRDKAMSRAVVDFAGFVHEAGRELAHILF